MSARICPDQGTRWDDHRDAPREAQATAPNSASAGQRLRKKWQALVHPIIDAGIVVGEFLVAMPDPKLIQPSHEPAGACAAARHE